MSEIIENIIDYREEMLENNVTKIVVCTKDSFHHVSLPLLITTLIATVTLILIMMALYRVWRTLGTKLLKVETGVFMCMDQALTSVIPYGLLLDMNETVIQAYANRK